jgi:hypothetical protein
MLAGGSMRFRLFPQVVALVLCWSLLTHLVSPRLAAQVEKPGASGRLTIIILEGVGALNNIKQGTAREPIVRVDDENHRPVAGAFVTFTLPYDGPGGNSLAEAKYFRQ